MTVLTKRILSMVLALCLCVAMLPMTAMEVGAATAYNPDAAVAYAAAHATDTPEIAGADCANFVSKCVTAGGIPVSEKVCRNLMEALKPYAAKVTNLEIVISGGYGRVPTSGNNARILSKGDVMFVCCERCKSTGNNYERHAVIYSGESDSKGYAKCYAHTSVANNTTFWVGYDGTFACSNKHPTSYLAAEVVHFYDGVTSHTCDRGTYVYYEAVHPHYKCYKCSICGEVSRNTQEPIIVDSCSICVSPGKPTLTGMQRVYESGNPVTFTWEETENTTHYNIWLDKKDAEGEWAKYEHLTYVSNGVKKNLPDGEYRCLVQSYNSNYWFEDGSDWLYTESDWVCFIVGDHDCDKGEYVYFQKAHPHYNCYKCSVCGEIWPDMASPNCIDSCLECQKPQKPEFTNLKDVYLNSDTITFEWEPTENTTHYNIWLEKKDADGEWKKYEHVTYVTSGVQKNLPDGEYRCTLQSYNSSYRLEDGSDWLYTESDPVYLTVTASTAMETPVGEITFKSVEAKAGDTVSVAIYLDNNPGVAYAKFKVDYSDVLTLVSAENQAVLSGTFTTSQTADVKPYVLQWMGADNSTKNGCFVILTFRVAEDAKDGVYDITMTCSEAYNAAYEDATFAITNASVTVTSHVPGDVNGDNKVNGKDGVLLAQYLAEWGVTINMDAADVNGDGKVNGKDGILLAQYLAEWDVILG